MQFASAAGTVLAHPSKRFKFTLRDDEVRDAYEFVTDDGLGQDGTIVFLTGSGCRSDAYLRVWFKRLQGSYRILAMNKIGVDPSAIGDHNCSDEYVRNFRVGREIDEQAQFARAMFQKYPSRANILFGVSEGGWVAPSIAAQTPAANDVVLFSSGDGKYFDTMSLRHYSNAADKAHWMARLNALLTRTDTQARAFPHSYPDFSVGWFQDMAGLSGLQPIKSLHVRVLMAQGGKDETVPVASAHEACSILTKTKNDVSYFFEPSGNHGMQTPDGQSGSRFFHAFRQWSMGKPDAHLSKTCPY